MRITVQIDTSTPEGQQLVDYLRSFPEVVSFEDNKLLEPHQNYTTKPLSNYSSSNNYVTAEDFRVEAKKRAKNFLKKHGLHS